MNARLTCTLVVFICLGLSWNAAAQSPPAGPSGLSLAQGCAAPSAATSGLNFPADKSYLQLAAADGGAYNAIDGDRMKRLVEAQAAIARRYRDAGNQYWGRIIGTEADHETAAWMMEELRRAGAENLRTETIQLPPQWLPASWRVTAVQGQQEIRLDSAFPTYASVGTPAAGVELEVIDVGLGRATDFFDREVQGKAVIVHAIPTSGAIIHSATRDGAIRRADEMGAAAILVVLELPGNLQMALYQTDTSVPTLALGAEDGAVLQRMLTNAQPDDPVTISLQLAVEQVSGLTTSTVRGEVPAAAPDAERVIIVAHRDSYFEGGSDNASGVATAIELLRYFAQVPPAQRRRTIEVIGTPGHHNLASTGYQWLLDKQAALLDNTALLINAEHTAHALIDRWGDELCTTNSLGPFSWQINGSARLIDIALGAFDAFGIPRWAESGGPTGEIRPLFNQTTSIVLMHAGVLLHSNIESTEAIPAASLAATTRAYARIIEQVNQLTRSELSPPQR